MHLLVAFSSYSRSLNFTVQMQKGNVSKMCDKGPSMTKFAKFTYHLLPLSYASHSPSLGPAQLVLCCELFTLENLTMCVISNDQETM